MFGVTVSGRGRAWETNEPLGFWRTFAALDTEDSEAVLEIYRRYGDPNPDNFLNSGVKSHTYGWRKQQATFSEMLLAWNPPGRDGISRARESNALPDRVFVNFSELLINADEKRPRIGTQYIRTGYRFVCRNLSDFMAASAMEMWLARIPMRQCDICGHWYGLQRRTAKVCSASCRNVKSRKAREKNVTRP